VVTISSAEHQQAHKQPFGRGRLAFAIASGKPDR
jgi:hypothetical protein